MFLLAALLFGAGARAQTATRGERLIERLERGGVQCVARRAFLPRALEAEEIRCRALALATFSTPERRTRWLVARSRESWFPARYVVYGRLWAVWTWSSEIAQSARGILGGRVVAVRLPPPIPHVEKRCEAGPRARPTPMSPAGPVYSYKREFWDTDVTDTCTGLIVAAETAPGTWALTGVAQSFKDGGPLSGIPVVLRSTHVDGVEDAPETVIRTVTDREGGYAFIDVPVTANGSCYLLTIEAGTFGRFEYKGYFATGEQYQQTVDMELAGVGDGDAGCFPPVGGP